MIYIDKNNIRHVIVKEDIFSYRSESYAEQDDVMRYWVEFTVFPVLKEKYGWQQGFSINCYTKSEMELLLEKLYNLFDDNNKEN